MTSPSEILVNKQNSPRWRWAVIFFLCLIIVGIGMGLSKYISNTAPKAHKKAPAIHISRVETLELFPGDYQVSINAMGTVVPAREVILKSRVSGQVQSLNPEFIAGGIIGKGERILKIDPRDYQLALVRKESQLISAQYGLKVEMGYQEVAKREWLLLNRGKPADPTDVELALRKPHLARTQSDIAAAQAELDQAKLNLSRTDIKAPFNVLVREKFVDIGSQISTQDAMAELVGTDEYWVRAALPVGRLKWIRIPSDRSQKGATATIYFRSNQRSGRVIQMLGNLETKGRMARILISVKDPLGFVKPEFGSPPLLIGEYVRVKIQGNRLSSVYRIPRSALRDNSTVWLVGSDDTLKIQTIKTVWRDEEIVVVENHFSPGDRLVTSDLATPVNGMPVETESNDSEKDSSLGNGIGAHHES